jgi:uncharacterized membrane protein YkgB
MQFQHIGNWIIKLGLWIIFIWIGLYKFTPTEAQAILPLVENSPFFSWQLHFFSPQTVSNSIGVIELATAGLMIAGLRYVKLGNIGYAFGAITFVITFTFLFTTPGMFKMVDGLWVANGFILKDIGLMGACLTQLKV